MFFTLETAAMIFMWAALCAIIVLLVWRCSDSPKKIRNMILAFLLTFACLGIAFVIVLVAMATEGTTWQFILFPFGSVGFLLSAWLIKKGIF